MTLPPLCNVCALFEPDTQQRTVERQRLQHSGFFARVQESDDWLLALSPLPGALPKGLLGSSPVFCEGEDLFTDEGPQSLSELARRCREAPQTLARFSGDFTFLNLHARGEVTLVRSATGRVPLYHAVDRGRVLVASRLDYMVAFGAAPPRVDGLATALALTGYGMLPEPHSPLAGTSLLPSGSCLTLTPQGQGRATRYWSPRRALVRPNAARRREHSEALYVGLRGALQRELDPTDGNLLWLSGGVDSSALAALVRGDLGLPLCAQTFTAPDAISAQHDDTYLRPLQARYHFERSWRHTLTPDHYLELSARGPRVSYPVSFFPLSALPQLTRDTPVRVALGGEFADEGTGSVRNIGDWLDHASAQDLLGRSPTGHTALRQWLVWQVKRRFHGQRLRLPATLPEGTRSELQREYMDWAQVERARFARDDGPLRTLWFRVQHDAWRAEGWEAATSLGVRPLAPFYTRELLELYFDCHPSEWFDAQRPKALLRRALHGKMPEQHRLRTDKGDWPGFFDGVTLPARAPSSPLARELLEDSWLHAHFGPTLSRSTQLPAFTALHLCWLGNMLGAVDTLARTPALGNEAPPPSRSQLIPFTAAAP